MPARCTIGRVEAAASHAGFDVYVQIQHMSGAGQDVCNEIEGMGGRYNAVPVVLRANAYMVGRSVWRCRLKDEDGLVFNHAGDVDSFVYAGNGKEINLGFFEDVDNFGNSMAVGVGFDDCTEFSFSGAEGF